MQLSFVNFTVVPAQFTDLTGRNCMETHARRWPKMERLIARGATWPCGLSSPSDASPPAAPTHTVSRYFWGPMKDVPDQYL